MPDCSLLADPDATAELATFEDDADRAALRIAPIGCSVPSPLTTALTDYRAFVHRDDGWWRSEVLVSVREYHHCAGHAETSWLDEGDVAMAEIATTVDCPLSSVRQAADYLVAIDVQRDEPASAVPILIDERDVPKVDAAADDRANDGSD